MCSFRLKQKISPKVVSRINGRQQIYEEAIRMSDLDRMNERCEKDWRKIIPD